MSTNSDKFYCDFCNEFTLCKIAPEFEPRKVKLCKTCWESLPKNPQEQLLKQVTEMKNQLEQREREDKDRRIVIGLIFIALGIATCLYALVMFFAFL